MSESKFWYRIVDANGAVVDGAEGRYLHTKAEAMASVAWFNVNYPERAPHVVQRTTRERVWTAR